MQVPVVSTTAVAASEPPREKEKEKEAAAASPQLNSDEPTVTPAKTDVSAGEEHDDYTTHRTCTFDLIGGRAREDH